MPIDPLGALPAPTPTPSPMADVAKQAQDLVGNAAVPSPLPAPTPSPTEPIAARPDLADGAPVTLPNLVDLLSSTSNIGGAAIDAAALGWQLGAYTPPPHYAVQIDGSILQTVKPSIAAEVASDHLAQLGKLSDGLGALGLAADVYGIATAEDPVKEAALVAGGMAGAELGAGTGATLGAGLCAATGLGLPAAPVCGVVGGIAGAIGGGLGGEAVMEAAYPTLESWAESASDYAVETFDDLSSWVSDFGSDLMDSFDGAYSAVEEAFSGWF